MNSMLKQQAGFTLIELAIVLVIIAVLIGSVIGSLTSRVENARITETRKDLELIKQHLIGYALTNGYLPCADCIDGTACIGGSTVRDGLEDPVATGSCDLAANNVGTLPWVTLGVGRSDAWNTRYRYWVDSDFSQRAPLDEFDLLAIGSGSIQEPDLVADATGLGLKNMANGVVAVIYSQGKNTYGGISTDDVSRPSVPVANAHEGNNGDTDNAFVSRQPSVSGASTKGGEFDDIVIWISEFELKARMVEAGQLP